VPEGTVVGVNGWVTHFDKKVFGEDAEFFRPERWLEADEEKVRMMNKNMVAVSAIPSEKLVATLTMYSLDWVTERVLVGILRQWWSQRLWHRWCDCLIWSGPRRKRSGLQLAVSRCGKERL
jgi:hypothetical protein